MSTVSFGQTSVPAVAQKRYLPLDAARGFVMIYLCTDGFGLSKLQGGPAAAASLLAGVALTPFIPIIHKCWTASYTFVHTACVLTMILFFVVAFGAAQREKYALPFVVVGMNSIFIYLVSNSLAGRWLDPTLAVFTGKFWFLGMAGPVVQAWAVFFAMWGLCYWLYRRRIFFKL